MSTDGQSTKRRRKIAENINRLSTVHQRYRQTDRQTTYGTAITYSERELEIAPLCPYLAPFLRYCEMLVESRQLEPTQPPFGAAVEGNFVGISPRFFGIKQSLWAILRRCLRDPIFSSFGTVPACVTQTDRQTDGQTDRH